MKHLLSCMAMLLSLACSAFSAHAAITMNTSVQYKIRNVNSGLVLGIAGASQAAGSKVVQWADNGTADHLWHFMPMGNGQYNIENMLTHQVLGVANAGTADGAQIVQWADNGTSDHLWTVTQAASGNFLIQNVNSGKYLEVYQASNLNTATIDQWASTGCTCQEWQLVNTKTSPYPAPRAVSGDGIFVHDPYMLRDAGGKYWLYGSHQTLATSTDLNTFTPYTSCTATQMGGYAPNCPPIGPDFSSWSGLQTPKGWNSGANTDIWAPSLLLANGTYYQYYSIPYLPSSGAEAVIGVATSSAPQGPWTERGFVTKSWTSTTTAPPSGFTATTDNAIDPAPFTDASGNWWMAWGSWTDGTHLMQLNPATGLKSTTNTTVYTLARRGAPTSAEEGPFIYYYNGYYYYFAPINACCSSSSPYRTIVGRSTSVTGPYVDRGGVALTAGGGTILLSTHGNVIGPGGGSVFTDAGHSNRPTFVYHYYDGNNNGRPTLGVNPLGFTSDGWPYVMAN